MIDLNSMKYGDFLQILEDISDLLVWYENTPYGKNHYTFYLSNGDKINYEIGKNNIAHLLGINTEYLKCANLFNETSSFELSQRLCNDSFGFYKRVSSGLLSYNNFISKYIDDKLKVFKLNFQLDFQNIEFICKYDSQRSYTTGFDKKDIDYLIISRVDDGKLKLLGLRNDGNAYVPVTSQLIDENTEFDRNVLASFLESQVLLLAESIIVTNDITGYKYKKFYYDVEMKKKIHDISKYVERYNCIVDVSHCYEYLLKKNVENRDLNDLVIGAICGAMDKGTTIDFAGLGINVGMLPKNLKGLLDSYCAFIEQYSSLDGGLSSLHLMKETIEQIKVEYAEKISGLSSEIDILRTNNSSLEQQIFNLGVQNKSYARRLSLIKEIINNDEE